MGTFKDKLTNIIAVIVVIAGAVNAYLQTLTGDINWFQLIAAVLTAIIAWYTGKDSNGKAKKVA